MSHPDCHRVERRVLAIVSDLRGQPVSASDAIYQDLGIYGDDIDDLHSKLSQEFTIPAFDWSRFAELSERPGHFVKWWFRQKPAGKKRLTLGHLATVITDGQWSEPRDV